MDSAYSANATFYSAISRRRPESGCKRDQGVAAKLLLTGKRNPVKEHYLTKFKR